MTKTARFWVAFAVATALMIAAAGLTACAGKGENAARADETATGNIILEPVPQSSSPASAYLSETLTAGTARADISPDKSVILGGYGIYFFSKKRCRWSEGVHDPLYASALYLGKGATGLILIAVDQLGLVKDDIIDIQNDAAARLPLHPEQIIVTSSHTHHAPDTIGLWGTILPPSSGRDEAYMATMKKRAARAAVDAFNSRRAATLQYAVGAIEDLHFNTYEDEVENAPIDHTLTVLKVNDTKGGTIARLANWGCHPTTEGMENLLVSSDWVGGYYHWMEKRSDGLPIFVNGAIGAAIQPNVHWRDENLHSKAQGFIWADTMGRKVAEAVLALDSEMKDVPFDRIEMAATKIVFPMTNEIYRVGMQLGVVNLDVPPIGEMGESRVTQAKLGPVRIVTVPGEIAAHLGDKVREAAGGEAQILVGLGNDYLGYIIDPQQYADKTYSYEKMLCAGPDLSTGIILAHQRLNRTIEMASETSPAAVRLAAMPLPLWAR